MLLFALPALAVEPAPPSVAEKSPALYPPELVEERVSGEVLLELLIDEAGGVADIRVVSSPHPLLETSAVTAAKRLRFHPARRGEETLAAWIQYAYRFDAPVEPRGTLVGTVLARGNRRPIVGAVVLDEKGKVVAETSVDGTFRASLPPGPHALSIVATAFELSSVQEEVRENETLEVLYRLQPQEVNPYEITVRAPVERVEVARIELSGPELREVPGTMGDPSGC